MKRKPIKIDWDELEEAFSTPAREAASYLDRISGHVILEGEGDDQVDEDAVAMDNPMAVATARTALAREDPTRIAIRPPDTVLKVEWMQEFIKQSTSEHDGAVLGELTSAIGSDDPAQGLRSVLNRNSEVRDAWFLYRSNRVHDRIETWLTEHEIEFTAPPPWR